MNQLVLTNPEARYGLDYIPILRYYADSVQLVPASATVKVYKYDLTTICTARVCSIAAGGDIAVVLTSGELTDYLNSYYIELTLGLGSATPAIVGTVIFAVALTPLVCPVVDDDLVKIAPKIISEIWSTQSNYASQIFLAFSDVKARISSKGDLPAKLIDAAQVKQAITWRALWYICQDFATDQGSKWYSRMLIADKEYNDAFGNVQLLIDSDYNKVVDEVEPQSSSTALMFS